MDIAKQLELFRAYKTLEDTPDFDGETYDPLQDHQRLSNALGKTWNVMRDGNWRTLAETAELVGCSEAGVSARLRDLRKPKYRTMYPTDRVESRRFTDGLWKYRIIVPARYKEAS